MFSLHASAEFMRSWWIKFLLNDRIMFILVATTNIFSNKGAEFFLQYYSLYFIVYTLVKFNIKLNKTCLFPVLSQYIVNIFSKMLYSFSKRLVERIVRIIFAIAVEWFFFNMFYWFLFPYLWKYFALHNWMCRSNC